MYILVKGVLSPFGQRCSDKESRIDPKLGIKMPHQYDITSYQMSHNELLNTATIIIHNIITSH